MTPDEATQVIEQIKCKPFKFASRCMDSVFWVRVGNSVADVNTGEQGFFKMDKAISLYELERMDKNMLARFVLHVLDNAVTHEVREWFTLADKRVFYPHPHPDKID